MTVMVQPLKILSYFSQFTPILALENVSKTFFCELVNLSFFVGYSEKTGIWGLFCF
ncbi:hypothetical protein SPYJRS4_1738 [Streptococcus pyogenes JRS4]|nr:hypothetical protein SPYJRS4_1738 [Streptococcus pyogenes JRS4]